MTAGVRVVATVLRLIVVCAIMFATTGFARAQNIITRDGDCAVTIKIPLELFSRKLVVTQDMGQKIQKQIEAAWNGPTKEFAEHIGASSNDVQHVKTSTGLPATFSPGDHDIINGLYKAFIGSVGGNPNCATVNCCQICIKVIWRVRLADDPPTPGFHQIELMPYKGDDGKWFRSHVDNLDGMSSVSGGQWNIEDVKWPSFAHEVGHLMGLDDQYHDGKDEKGDTIGIGEPGHENDIMNHALSWPQEDAFAQILKGLKIDISNCCKDPKPVIEVFNSLIRETNITVNSDCNYDLLDREIAKLQAEKAAIMSDNIPLAVKYDLIRPIDPQIERLKNRQLNCPERQRITETTNEIINTAELVIKLCNNSEVQETIIMVDAQRAEIVKAKSLSSAEKEDALARIDQLKEKLEKALQDCPPKETITVWTGFDGSIWCTYGFRLPIPVNIIPSDDVPTQVEQPKLPPYEVFKPGGPAIVEKGPGTPPPPVVPKTPLTPDTAKTPTTENTPQTPETPKTPELPKTPVAEKTPETPKTPDTPKTPETPNTPDQPPPPTATDTPPQIPDTIFVKASEEVLQGGQTGTPLGGQNVKLFPPNKPNLPGAGGTKTAQDTGFNKDPVECKTGADGGCQMKIDNDERPHYGLPARNGTPKKYRMDVDLPRKDGGVAEIDPHGPAPKKPDLPPGTVTNNDIFNIGDRTFIRIGFTYPYGPNLNFTPLYQPMLPRFETDFCRDKQPGPALDMQPVSLSAFNNELPAATVELDRRLRLRKGR